jgi:light-harvesting complex 1 beta chain
MADPGSMTGLSEDEAQEFHKIFMQSFIMFVGVAALAHLLAFIWRPWLLAEENVAALVDGAKSILPYIA